MTTSISRWTISFEFERRSSDVNEEARASVSISGSQDETNLSAELLSIARDCAYLLCAIQGTGDVVPTTLEEIVEEMESVLDNHYGLLRRKQHGPLTDDDDAAQRQRQATDAGPVAAERPHAGVRE